MTWLLRFATKFAGVRSDSNQIHSIDSTRSDLLFNGIILVAWIGLSLPRPRAATQFPGDTSKNKTIIDLALSSYLAENFGGAAKGMDATFKAFATSHMKFYIFAGRDTTASTICYVYHLLSRNPSVTEKSLSLYSAQSSKIVAIASKPNLLHQLPYTLAIIKETLRLLPAVTSPRAGQPGFFLTDSQGRQFQTKKYLLWDSHHGLHRNPLIGLRPTNFFPSAGLPPQTTLFTS